MLLPVLCRGPSPGQAAGVQALCTLTPERQWAWEPGPGGGPTARLVGGIARRAQGPSCPHWGGGVTPLLAAYVILDIFRHANPSVDPRPSLRLCCGFLFSLAGRDFKPTPDVTPFRASIVFSSPTGSTSGLRTLFERMVVVPPLQPLLTQTSRPRGPPAPPLRVGSPCPTGPGCQSS